MRKINSDKLLLFFISICVLADLQFFYIVQADQMIFKMVEVVASLLAFFIYLCKNNFIVSGNRLKLLRYVLFVLIYIFIIEAVFSIAYKQYLFYEFIADSYRYTASLLLLPLVEVLLNDSLRKRFERIMKIIAITQIMISFISLAILLFWGVNITTKVTSFRGDGFFNMSILMGNTLIILAIIISFFECMNESVFQKGRKEFCCNLFIIISGILYAVLVVKTRTLIIALVISLVSMVFFRKKFTKKIFILRIVILIALFGALEYVSSNGIVDRIFNLTEGVYASSNTGHLNAIIDCYEYFKKNWLLGAGINLDWPVSYCDSGFVGLLANLGIGGSVIFLNPLLYGVKTLWSNRGKVYGTLALGLLIFSILTSFTLILTDEQRIMTWIFIYALFYFIRKHDN